MSFSTSTGALTGTPTSVATATTYTVTATNSSGISTATFALKVTFANGSVEYANGSIGPGGGKIFYYSAAGFNCGSEFTSTGSPTGGLCHYLEAAPDSGATAWTHAQYNWSGNTSTSIGTTLTAIGTGYANTIAIVNQASGGDTASKAGTISRNYRGPNGLSDWYLPSKEELYKLYIERSNFVFQGDFYWSSSEYNASYSWVQQIVSASTAPAVEKRLSYYVLPIRSF
jgi:hypothetical protein